MQKSKSIDYQYSGPKIWAYIISWNNQHEKALLIADSILHSCEKVSIVYSDSDKNLSTYQKFSGNLIERSNQGVFSDKFCGCIEDFNADLMLIIHADCQSDNWSALLKRCTNAFKNIAHLGLWSPLIEWTAFDLSKTEIMKIHNTSLSIVVQTDTIVTAFSNIIVNRMRRFNYTKNIYGWGIGWAANAYALSNGYLSIVDREVKITHPKESGYQALEASKQRNLFLSQCTPQELVQLSMMRHFMTRNGVKLL
jgi:hypothetical protein